MRGVVVDGDVTGSDQGIEHPPPVTTTRDVFNCARCGKPTGEHYCGEFRPTQEELAPLVQEYESGQSIRDLAARYGVGYGMIHRRLLWGGAKMRPRGGRKR